MKDLEAVDVVMASDVICQKDDARLLVRAINALMKKDGIALIVLPAPENRFGTDHFPRYLSMAGCFCWQQHHITDPGLVDGIEEAAYFSWSLFVIWRSPSQSTKLPPSPVEPGTPMPPSSPGASAQPDQPDQAQPRSTTASDYPSPWHASISAAAASCHVPARCFNDDNTPGVGHGGAEI